MPARFAVVERLREADWKPFHRLLGKRSTTANIIHQWLQARGYTISRTAGWRYARSYRKSQLWGWETGGLGLLPVDDDGLRNLLTKTANGLRGEPLRMLTANALFFATAQRADRLAKPRKREAVGSSDAV